LRLLQGPFLDGVEGVGAGLFKVAGEVVNLRSRLERSDRLLAEVDSDNRLGKTITGFSPRIRAV